MYVQFMIRDLGLKRGRARTQQQALRWTSLACHPERWEGAAFSDGCFSGSRQRGKGNSQTQQGQSYFHFHFDQKVQPLHRSSFRVVDSLFRDYYGLQQDRHYRDSMCAGSGHNGI